MKPNLELPIAMVRYKDLVVDSYSYIARGVRIKNGTSIAQLSGRDAPVKLSTISVYSDPRCDATIVRVNVDSQKGVTNPGILSLC